MKYNLLFNTEDLTFVTTANNNYNFFIEPFIKFCQESNPGCKVEIWSDASNIFNYLSDKNVRIHLLPKDYHVATYRYILEPTFLSKYVYISDIDIMHTELIQPFHLIHMHQTGLPFSNIRRTNKGRTNRMSGLHFVEREFWYSKTKDIRAAIQPNGQDEEMLFEITKSICNINEISQGLANRPVQGIHCSVAHNPRNPYSSVGWEITSQKVAFFENVVKKYGFFNDFFKEKVCVPLLGSKTLARIQKN